MNVRPNDKKPNSLKQIVKRCMQNAASIFGRHTRSPKEPELLVLMYHRILPQNDESSLTEEPGMTVTPETFKQHLNILKEYFTIISLADWALLKKEGKKLPDKACAITFDDGWADNYNFAFPILKELKIPATIFLVSDMIGTKEVFWPERLSRLITTISSEHPQHWSHPELEWLQDNPDNYRFSSTPPTREELSSLIACAKQFTDQEVHDRISHIETVLHLDKKDYPASLLNWQQVADMTNSGLVEVGSHTCNHTRLNQKISDELLSKEVVDSKKTIEKHINKTVKTFCFPNGDFCPQALSLVKQNYDAAVTTQSGWNTTNSDPHLLQRIGVHQDIAQDKTAFLARISGWM